MKHIPCSELGGPATCNEMISGSTADEMVTNGWKHLQEAHPEVAQNIMNNPKDVNDKWMTEFKEKFESLPEA